MVNGPALSSVTDRTATLVREILARNAGPQEFRPSDPLVDVGLTSLDLVQLMLAVESEFDILIPPTSLNAQTFTSTETIARMVVLVASEREAPAHA